MASKLANKFVAKSIPKLYLHSDTADVHFLFTTDDEIIKVPAHKAILAIKNPVFGAMFYGPMKENDVVEIVDASASAFEEFLQFFYLPEVLFTIENIEAVTRLADKYDMLECLNSCAEFLENQLTKDNIIWGYQLAISLKNQKLKQSCETEIEMLTSDIFESTAFLHCDRSVVEHILQLESLNSREVEVFNACIEWAKSACQANGLDENDPENLKNQLGHCFHLIRFETMAYDEIDVILSNELYEGLFSRDELRDLFCMKSDEGFESKVFKHTQRSIRALKWNVEEVLTCVLGRGRAVYTRSQESTWFSVNVPVLLENIVCATIGQGRGISANISSKMSIIEYNEHTFVATDATKVLHTTTETLMVRSNTSILLPEPIVVHPKKLYEIRFEPQTNANGYGHISRLKSELKLDRGVTIKIHQNPSEYESDRRGLVSELGFNRI